MDVWINVKMLNISMWRCMTMCEDGHPKPSAQPILPPTMDPFPIKAPLGIPFNRVHQICNPPLCSSL